MNIILLDKSWLQLTTKTLKKYTCHYVFIESMGGLMLKIMLDYKIYKPVASP